MRRFFFGLLWFLVFYFAGLAVGGGIAGALAGGQGAGTSASSPNTFSKGYTAGEEFGRKYGVFFLFGSLVLAVGGSALGILPGTKPKRPKEPTDA